MGGAHFTFSTVTPISKSTSEKDKVHLDEHLVVLLLMKFGPVDLPRTTVSHSPGLRALFFTRKPRPEFLSNQDSTHQV